ncbi:hypothetical protein B5M09_012689 [Aphanomyces astaci]|uniref:Uncharacterized protein n=1 Tax=Aphanomyces astaci TaxID=112090 RepID=A0A3R7YJ90_APHAT|nr:hypothetical protein B5M09_012689 [Aphanomyces astaci]
MYLRPPLSRVMKEFEVLGARTVYSRITDARNPTKRWHQNLIRKHYPSADNEQRDVFIARAVLEDALTPYTPHSSVENKWVWMQVAADPHVPNSCQFTLLVQLQLEGDDAAAVEDGSEVTFKMNQLGVVDRPGFLPSTPSMLHLDPSRLPPSHLRLFVEGGNRMHVAVTTAINAVVHRYTTRSS